MVFESLLHPIFAPLLALPPVAAIALISFLISIIITLVYKFMTDQTMMKDLKTRQKEMQKKMKALRGEPDKLMKVQKEAMDVNMKYMTQSFKPTLITFLPIIIIFGWLNAHMAYDPIMPGQEFSATATFHSGFNGDVSVSVPQGIDIVGDAVKPIGEDGTVMFNFKGEEGNYLIVFEHDGRSYDKELTITSGREYAPVQKTYKKAPLSYVTLGNSKLIAINLFGLGEEGHWYQGRLGWLGTYIIFSIAFSMGLRKLLKIY